MFEIVYHQDVVDHDIPTLGTTPKPRIKKAIKSKLSTHPDLYGKPLRRSLKGYRKLRVGDYRVIFALSKTQVKIFIIAPRSVVYRKTSKRL